MGEGIRIKLEGEGGKGEKVVEVTQRNLKGRRKNLEGIRRTEVTEKIKKEGEVERESKEGITQIKRIRGKEEIEITGESQMETKETGMARTLHQRRVKEGKRKGEKEW